MKAAKGQGTWVQCTECGKIFFIEEAVPIDELYVTAVCSRCGNYKAINCGNKKEDIYHYYDPYLDERYYEY